MTLEELRAKYTVAYRIIMREREMRDCLFAAHQSTREAKMHDMDVLLEVVDDMKDELKRRISGQAQQPTLLDVVRKVQYP